MQKIIFISISLLFLLGITACKNKASKKVKKENIEAKANKVADTANLPKISFDKTQYDFGVIKEGKKVETEFTFTNTGKTDLIITNASGSCGCTVPEYPKNTPIAPGEEGKIKVSFDSNYRPGNQQKTVTLVTNTLNKREILRIKANVTPDPVKEKERVEARKQREQQQQQN